MSLSGQNIFGASLGGSSNGTFNNVNTNSIQQQNPNLDIIVKLLNSMGFSIVGGTLKIGGSSTTLTTINTTGINGAQTLTLPNVNGGSDTIMATGSVDTLTNKTLVSTTNTIAANNIMSGGSGNVAITATNPTAGQVLTAINGTSASWQTPGAGGDYGIITIQGGTITVTASSQSNRNVFMQAMTLGLASSNFQLNSNTYGIQYIGPGGNFRVVINCSLYSGTTTSVSCGVVVNSSTSPTSYASADFLSAFYNANMTSVQYITLATNDTLYHAIWCPSGGSTSITTTVLNIDIVQL